MRRRAWLLGLIDATRAEEGLDDLAAWPLIRYAHDLFLSRIWELRHNVTAYDAVYVALAETLAATLLTCDARLASSSGHHAVIEIASCCCIACRHGRIRRQSAYFPEEKISIY